MPFTYQTNSYQTPFQKLVLKTSSGGLRPDYASFISQYLKEIGIEVEVIIQEWSVFVGELTLSHDYDLAVVGISSGSLSPNYGSMYTEDGVLNMFSLSSSIPYQNESESIQNEILTISDLSEKLQKHYDLQQLIMDKIVPLCPLFSRKTFKAVWSNILGYDYGWDWIASSPYMSFDGLHDGQVSTNEWNQADAIWSNLNPLLSIDTSSKNLQELIFEAGWVIPPNLIPLKTGLIYDWDEITQNHYKFYVRDNIYWNPSYDVTYRTSSSPPLDTIPTNELIIGLKNGEYSDGSNQLLTAKDFVFTYLAWAYQEISKSPNDFAWIEECYVDPSDPLAFHIHIDGDYKTPETELYMEFWNSLAYTKVLPEFFLNSTNPFTDLTLGGCSVTGLYKNSTHDITKTPQWISFSSSSFGVGQYMVDYYVPHSVTVLQRSPYWHGIGVIDGVGGKTPMVEEFNMRVIPDATAELAEFKAGKLDIVGVTSFPTERKEMQENPKYSVYSKISNSIDFLAFNLERPFIGGENNNIPLTIEDLVKLNKGVAIRKAICYAINRNEMNEVLLDGEGIIVDSITSPYYGLYYYDDIIKYQYNLDEAKKWLSAALDFPPVYSIWVENHQKVGEDIIIKINFTQRVVKPNVTLIFRINNGEWNYSEMSNEAENLFYFNLRSNLKRKDYVEFYLKISNEFGFENLTKVYSFEVGKKNEELFVRTASSPNLIIISTVFLLISIVIRKGKNKKNKINLR